MYRYKFYFNVGWFETYAGSEDDAWNNLVSHLEETVGTNEHYGKNLVDLLCDLAELEETDEPQERLGLSLEERNR